MSSEPPPTAAGLRAAFDAPAPLTVGLEEELMLLDPETLDLVPRAREVISSAGDDPRLKLELPASQVEIVTAAHRSVPEAVAELAAGRADLARAASGLARPAAAAVHPFAPAEGELNRDERYDHTIEEFGRVAKRQLVCALQVHVAVGGADRTLAVHNALRSYLPELAALAANGPFYEGRDTGLASVRPKISEGLPRQGVPPPLSSWDDFAEDLRWGARAGSVHSPRVWWWELRAHPVFGTLELRVPDAQTTVGEAAGVAAFAHCLVGLLVERFDAGGPLGCDPTWRIEENRWSACSRGVESTLADLDTGERRPARERLAELLGRLAPVAERLGCPEQLASGATLVERNGAIRQREVAAAHGLDGLARWLADRFLDGPADRSVAGAEV
jgi:glutamate---cysteine ligase / carboxylate-amine ligase